MRCLLSALRDAHGSYFKVVSTTDIKTLAASRLYSFELRRGEGGECGIRTHGPGKGTPR